MKKYDPEAGMPYNPDDESIWYNQKKLREKMERIQEKFGKPFLITKDGMMLYEDCTVIPCFRDENKYE